MRIKNLIKILGIITFLFLLPSISNAQIQRVWSIAEYTSTMLPPPSGGTKVAYRTLNNSLYYWNGTIWKRIAGPGIVDTTYSLSFTSPTLSLLGSGSSVSLTNLYTAGYGLTKTAETWRVDTSAPDGLATRIFTNRFLLKSDTTTFLASYIDGFGTTTRIPIFTGNRTIANSPIAYNSTTKRTTWDSPGVIELPMGTDAQRPSPATTSDFWYNTTSNGIEWYNGTRWAKGLESTANRFTAGSLIFADANGQATQDNANLFWNNSTKRLGIGTNSPSQALEIYTPTTTSINLLKLQTATHPAANILFNMNGFQGTISANLLSLASTQGTAPSILMANNQITASFATASPNNSINLRANTLVGGSFGFFFTSNTERKYYVMQQDPSYIGGFDVGVNFATYDHRNTPATNDKGQVQFKMSPSKETWVGDGVVNTNYNFYVTQPSVGYGQITTVSGNSTIAGFGLTTFFTKDFNVGTSIVINATTFTITGITNDYTATVTPTPGFSGTYNYTINNASPIRFGVYKNGGVEINQATGQTRYELQVTGTNGIGFPRGATSTRPIWVTATNPIRFNTDSTAFEYATAAGTWSLFATRAYARSLVTGLGTGTVTSVGLSLPSIFSVSGSPVTTSGTLSASFVGGSSSQFLRGDGRWMKSLYFNSSDSIQFNITDPYFGSTALVSMKGNDAGFDSRFNIADYGYVNQALAIATTDDARYNFDRSRGTIASPSALLKDDRIGGVYFRAHNGSSYRKAGYIGAVVDSIHSGANPQAKLIFGTSEVNSPETSSYWRFIIKSNRNISVVNHVTGSNMGVGFSSVLSVMETAAIEARFHVKGAGTTTGKTMLLEDSGGADILTITDNKTIQAHGYGTGTKEAADLSKTQSNYIAGFATDGTVLDLGLGSGLSVSGGLLTSANIGNSNLTLTGNRTLSGAFTLDLDPTTVRLYGKYNLPDETPDLNKSTAIGFFNGAPAMIQLARDTFIEDVTLFSVGTLLNTCQELTIVSSMTALAPTNMEIRFPDASDVYRGRKIIVYSKKKDAGAFIPQIKVVGGASRLYFTTNPAVGGTDPSDQSTLSIDDSTWSDHGTSFEFTCLRIDNTPSYRWVLKQR